MDFSRNYDGWLRGVTRRADSVGGLRIKGQYPLTLDPFGGEVPFRFG